MADKGSAERYKPFEIDETARVQSPRYGTVEEGNYTTGHVMDGIIRRENSKDSAKSVILPDHSEVVKKSIIKRPIAGNRTDIRETGEAASDYAPVRRPEGVKTANSAGKQPEKAAKASALTASRGITVTSSRSKGGKRRYRLQGVKDAAATEAKQKGETGAGAFMATADLHLQTAKLILHPKGSLKRITKASGSAMMSAARRSDDIGNQAVYAVAGTPRRVKQAGKVAVGSVKTGYRAGRNTVRMARRLIKFARNPVSELRAVRDYAMRSLRAAAAKAKAGVVRTVLKMIPLLLGGLFLLAPIFAALAQISSVTLKSDDEDLAKTYEYITKLDAELTEELRTLVNNRQYRKIDEFHFYLDGAETNVSNITIKTDADAILAYLDIKYNDYALGSSSHGASAGSLADVDDDSWWYNANCIYSVFSVYFQEELGYSEEESDILIAGILGTIQCESGLDASRIEEVYTERYDFDELRTPYKWSLMQDDDSMDQHFYNELSAFAAQGRLGVGATSRFGRTVTATGGNITAAGYLAWHTYEDPSTIPGFFFGGISYIQWTGNNAIKYLDFCDANGLDWWTPEGALVYMLTPSSEGGDRGRIDRYLEMGVPVSAWDAGMQFARCVGAINNQRGYCASQWLERISRDDNHNSSDPNSPYYRSIMAWDRERQTFYYDLEKNYGAMTADDSYGRSILNRALQSQSSGTGGWSSGNKVKREIREIHDALYSYTVHEWEEDVEETVTNPGGEEEVENVTVKHLDILISTKGFLPYARENLLNASEAEQLSAFQEVGCYTTKVELGNPFPDAKVWYISERWGYRYTGSRISRHTGIDIPQPSGTDISCVKTGEVTEVGYDPVHEGSYVKIKTGDNEVVYGSLLNSANLAVGDLLQRGDIVGQVGDSHLHMEYWRDGKQTNPLFYIEASARGFGTDIVSVALSQIGQVGGRPYWGDWYGHSERFAWCACFISWCADQCGYLSADIIPNFIGCDFGVEWFKARGLWQPGDGSYVPKTGDIIFFNWDGEYPATSYDHVAIVEYFDGAYVHTVEGNTGAYPGSVATGQYSLYSSVISGYGTPAYP